MKSSKHEDTGKFDKPTLLLVDDEPELLETTKQLCEELDCRILTATNGQEALDIVKNETVEAILSDINMPKMTGLQFLKEIRGLGLEVPFIVLSGYGDRANVTQALRLGANDFLDKPFDDQHLLTTLRWALDFGSALRYAENAMKLIYDDSKISDARKEQLRKAHKAVLTIKEQRLRGQKKAS